VKGLVLIAPLGLGTGVDLAALNAVAEIADAAEMQRFLERLVADPALIQPVFADYALQQLNRPGARDAMARIAAALPEYIAEVQDHIDAVRSAGLPVTVVWGEEDAVAQPDRARIEALGDFVEIEGAGHIPHVEAAKVVNRLLKERLRS
ncbi:MAG: alpha/beta fold hydrolase, partial [Pseudomonadota bacterium]